VLGIVNVLCMHASHCGKAILLCCFCREDDETDEVPAAKRKRDISNVPPLTAFFSSVNTFNAADGVKGPPLPRHRFLKNCGLIRVQNL